MFYSFKMFFLCFPGAAIMGGGADPSGAAAEVSGGGTEEA